MTEAKQQKVFRVVTPKARLSFPQLFQPRAFAAQEPKYSATFLFPKDTDLSAVKHAIRAAIIAEWGPDKAKWPKNMKMPLKDGDEKSDLQGYEGNYYLVASSKQKPGVVSRARQPIEEGTNEIYAGCYVRAAVTFKAFIYRENNVAVSRGVACYLGNVQFLEKGEPFSSSYRAPEDDFDELTDEDGTADASGSLDDELGL